MEKVVEINYINAEKNIENEETIELVLKRCFEHEGLDKLNLYISVTLTCPEEIRKINNEFREIDKETDVLSFPMFEREEIQKLLEKGNSSEVIEVLGDIVISVQRVEEQAKEYGHSFQRELSYMVVHGFYHLMGYDHMEELDKIEMRKKEEVILNELNITR